MYCFIAITVVHIAAVFLPLLDGLALNVSKEPLYPFYIPTTRLVPFDGVKGKWTIRLDDLYQGGLGILFMCLLQPLTIVWRRFRSKTFNLSLALHIFGGVVYIWLIYRVRLRAVCMWLQQCT
jgi:hypothetical protein